MLHHTHDHDQIDDKHENERDYGRLNKGIRIPDRLIL